MTLSRTYIWQRSSWPSLKRDDAALIKHLGECRFQQGQLLARMKSLGFEMRLQARAEVFTQEALKTSEIEGERLDPQTVRSSVARRLGLTTAGLPTARNRQAEGLVDLLLDATRNFNQPLTAKRLYGWHAGLFPTGYSGIHKIRVAVWRSDKDGPMQVVSGPIGHERVHHAAPPAKRLKDEMASFLHWWRASRETMDGILRAGQSHLWFVAVHPFEDGNGRIARALTEMALAQDEGLETRFYSLSSQIMADREAYYDVLERTNTGNGDVTEWMQWFLASMSKALIRSQGLLGDILLKGRFWEKHAQTPFSDRQSKAINRLLDAGPGGFEGGLTNRKYAGMTHVSRATAQRELADLVRKGILHPQPGGGRSRSYDLNWDTLKETGD